MRAADELSHMQHAPFSIAIRVRTADVSMVVHLSLARCIFSVNRAQVQNAGEIWYSRAGMGSCCS